MLHILDISYGDEGKYTGTPMPTVMAAPIVRCTLCCVEPKFVPFSCNYGSFLLPLQLG